MLTGTTREAVGAITRLRDMGIEPFLLASTVRLVLAQRLVRRLCTRCRAPRETDARERQLMGDGFDGLLYRAVGCAHCNHTGYRSEERRVGKECVRKCRSRRAPEHSKKKPQ